MRELSVCSLNFAITKPLWGKQTDLTCSRHTGTDWHLTWVKSWCLNPNHCGLSLWVLHTQVKILLFPEQFYPQGCSVPWSQQPRLPTFPLCPRHNLGPLHHMVPPHPCPAPPGSGVCMPWILSQILIVFYAPVHSVYKGKAPFSWHFAPGSLPLQKWVFQQEQTDAKPKLFSVTWSARRFFIFLVFRPVQGDRPAELKIFVRQFFRIFAFH